MRAKFVNEQNIGDILKPKSKEEILKKIKKGNLSKIEAIEAIRQGLVDFEEVQNYIRKFNFGEKKSLELVRKYLPYLQNPLYNSQNNIEDIKAGSFYGEDEQYVRWDIVDFDIPEIHESASLLIAQENENDPIGIKFYFDAVSYNGSEHAEEHRDGPIQLANIKNFSKEDYNQFIEDLKEVQEFDEDTYQEDQKRYAEWDKRAHDPNDPYFSKEANYRIEDGYLKGQMEYEWDEKLGKWLNPQQRYDEYTKRGLILDPISHKWIPKEEKENQEFNDWLNKWQSKEEFNVWLKNIKR
jgi:hypothetical protein